MAFPPFVSKMLSTMAAPVSARMPSVSATISREDHTVCSVVCELLGSSEHPRPDQSGGSRFACRSSVRGNSSFDWTYSGKTVDYLVCLLIFALCTS